jgi:hypothetical protein
MTFRYKAIRITHDDLWEDDWEEYKSISVFEQMPVDTGLIDVNEVPIYRVKEPIGFKLS